MAKSKSLKAFIKRHNIALVPLSEPEFKCFPQN